jgi:hypothetical protein
MCEVQLQLNGSGDDTSSFFFAELGVVFGGEDALPPKKFLISGGIVDFSTTLRWNGEQ